ncbi:MAG: hypothetical protein ABIT23_01610 [Nitrosospira sp.]
MKFFPISTIRSLTPALILASAIIFGATGVAHAQYGDSTSGPGSSAGQGNSPTAPGGDKGKYDATKHEMDSGYVDQKKRVERANDPTSPSKDTHVPNFPVDKDGKPLKDPRYEQGGSIGPN